MGLSGRRVGPEVAGLAAGGENSPMTDRSWMRRLLAHVMPFRGRTAWQTRRFVRLTLQPLPDRNGPSSLVGAEASLLLGLNSGDSLQSASSYATDSPPATTSRPDAAPGLSPTANHLWASPGIACEPATGDARTGVPAQPTAFAPLRHPTDFFSFGAIEVRGVDQGRGAEPVFVGSPPPPLSRPISGIATAGITTSQPEPTFTTLVPASLASPPLITLPQHLAFPAEVGIPLGDAVPPRGSESARGESSAAVVTPPTFIDDLEPLGDVQGEGVTPTSREFPTSILHLDGATASPPLPGHPARQVEPETAGTSNVIVTPVPDVSGRPLGTDTGVFRISRGPGPSERLEVHYTLAAHGAGGTVSIDRSVVLPGGSDRVTITPGSALAGSQPQVFTIILRDQPTHHPGRAAATLFVAPPGGRIGDSALFEAHRMGRSPEAFEALVQRHGTTVSRVCQRIVGNWTDAEDVTQFVFLRLAQWQGRFPGTLTGWLRAVSKNASLTLLRSRRRRRRHEREAAKPASTEPLDTLGLDECLDAAIRQLPATLEQAVRMRYLEGRSQQEAAQLLGCPRGTLSRRAAHGIRVLRELLVGNRAITG